MVRMRERATRGMHQQWGFEIGRVPSGNVIVHRIDNASPLFYSSIKVGDIIISVNGEKCDSATLPSLRDMIAKNTMLDMEYDQKPGLWGQSVTGQPSPATRYYSFGSGMTNNAVVIDMTLDDDDMAMTNNNLATPFAPRAPATPMINSTTSNPWMSQANQMTHLNQIFSNDHDVIDLVSDDEGDDPFGALLREDAYFNQRNATQPTFTNQSAQLFNHQATAYDMDFPGFDNLCWKSSQNGSPPAKKKRKIDPSPGNTPIKTETKNTLVPKKFGECDIPGEIEEIRMDAKAEAVTSLTNDDDIEIIGGNFQSAVDMPHQREACSKFPFNQYGNTAVNKLYCSFCYCYVCDILASLCQDWSRHCSANCDQQQWRRERDNLKSPLASLLSPQEKIKALAYCRKHNNGYNSSHGRLSYSSAYDSSDDYDYDSVYNDSSDSYCQSGYSRVNDIMQEVNKIAGILRENKKNDTTPSREDIVSYLFTIFAAMKYHNSIYQFINPCLSVLLLIVLDNPLDNQLKNAIIEEMKKIESTSTYHPFTRLVVESKPINEKEFNIQSLMALAQKCNVMMNSSFMLNILNDLRQYELIFQIMQEKESQLTAQTNMPIFFQCLNHFFTQGKDILPQIKLLTKDLPSSSQLISFRNSLPQLNVEPTILLFIESIYRFLGAAKDSATSSSLSPYHNPMKLHDIAKFGSQFYKESFTKLFPADYEFHDHIQVVNLIKEKFSYIYDFHLETMITLGKLDISLMNLTEWRGLFLQLMILVVRQAKKSIETNDSIFIGEADKNGVTNGNISEYLCYYVGSEVFNLPISIGWKHIIIFIDLFNQSNEFPYLSRFLFSRYLFESPLRTDVNHLKQTLQSLIAIPKPIWHHWKLKSNHYFTEVSPAKKYFDYIPWETLENLLRFVQAVKKDNHPEYSNESINFYDMTKIAYEAAWKSFNYSFQRTGMFKKDQNLKLEEFLRAIKLIYYSKFCNIDDMKSIEIPRHLTQKDSSKSNEKEANGYMSSIVTNGLIPSHQLLAYNISPLEQFYYALFSCLHDILPADSNEDRWILLQLRRLKSLLLAIVDRLNANDDGQHHLDQVMEMYSQSMAFLSLILDEMIASMLLKDNPSNFYACHTILENWSKLGIQATSFKASDFLQGLKYITEADIKDLDRLYDVIHQTLPFIGAENISQYIEEEPNCILASIGKRYDDNLLLVMLQHLTPTIFRNFVKAVNSDISKRDSFLLITRNALDKIVTQKDKKQSVKYLANAIEVAAMTSSLPQLSALLSTTYSITAYRREAIDKSTISSTAKKKLIDQCLRLSESIGKSIMPLELIISLMKMVGQRNPTLLSIIMPWLADSLFCTDQLDSLNELKEKMNEKLSICLQNQSMSQSKASDGHQSHSISDNQSVASMISNSSSSNSSSSMPPKNISKAVYELQFYSNPTVSNLLLWLHHQTVTPTPSIPPNVSLSSNSNTENLLSLWILCSYHLHRIDTSTMFGIFYTSYPSIAVRDYFYDLISWNYDFMNDSMVLKIYQTIDEYQGIPNQIDINELHILLVKVILLLKNVSKELKSYLTTISRTMKSSMRFPSQEKKKNAIILPYPCEDIAKDGLKEVEAVSMASSKTSTSLLSPPKYQKLNQSTASESASKSPFHLSSSSVDFESNALTESQVDPSNPNKSNRLDHIMGSLYQILPKKYRYYSIYDQGNRLIVFNTEISHQDALSVLDLISNDNIQQLIYISTREALQSFKPLIYRNLLHLESDLNDCLTSSALNIFFTNEIEIFFDLCLDTIYSSINTIYPNSIVKNMLSLLNNHFSINTICPNYNHLNSQSFDYHNFILEEFIKTKRINPISQINPINPILIKLIHLTILIQNYIDSLLYQSNHMIPSNSSYYNESQELVLLLNQFLDKLIANTNNHPIICSIVNYFKKLSASSFYELNQELLKHSSSSLKRLSNSLSQEINSRHEFVDFEVDLLHGIISNIINVSQFKYGISTKLLTQLLMSLVSIKDSPSKWISFSSNESKLKSILWLLLQLPCFTPFPMNTDKKSSSSHSISISIESRSSSSSDNTRSSEKSSFMSPKAAESPSSQHSNIKVISNTENDHKDRIFNGLLDFVHYTEQDMFEISRIWSSLLETDSIFIELLQKQTIPLLSSENIHKISFQSDESGRCPYFIFKLWNSVISILETYQSRRDIEYWIHIIRFLTIPKFDSKLQMIYSDPYWIHRAYQTAFNQNQLILFLQIIFYQIIQRFPTSSHHSSNSNNNSEFNYKFYFSFMAIIIEKCLDTSNSGTILGMINENMSQILTKNHFECVQYLKTLTRNSFTSQTIGTVSSDYIFKYICHSTRFLKFLSNDIIPTNLIASSRAYQSFGFEELWNEAMKYHDPMELLRSIDIMISSRVVHYLHERLSIPIKDVLSCFLEEMRRFYLSHNLKDRWNLLVHNISKSVKRKKPLEQLVLMKIIP